MAFVLGVLAALASPLTMTVGLIFLENHWKGGAYALTMLECNMVSIGFLIAALVAAASENDGGIFSSSQKVEPVFTVEPILFLLLSSLLGIIIGDITWFNALRLLGARRVMVLESIKPFVAAFFGYIILDEKLRLAAIGGITLTVVGILLVALETDDTENPGDAESLPSKQDMEDGTGQAEGSSEDQLQDAANTSDKATNKSENENEEDPTLESPVPPVLSGTPAAAATTESSNEEQSTVPARSRVRTRRQMQIGYVLAITNAALDTYGAVLTKEHGAQMTIWEINLIRFGFAGLCMSACSGLLIVRDYLLEKQLGTTARENPEGSQRGRSDHDNQQWYKIPPLSSMTCSAWLLVSVGVAFATFFTPALITYALFQIAIALTTTLGSVGPLYALPLTYIMQKHQQRPTIKAWAGAFLAVGGIVVLSFWGTLDDEK